MDITNEIRITGPVQFRWNILSGVIIISVAFIITFIGAPIPQDNLIRVGLLLVLLLFIWFYYVSLTHVIITEESVIYAKPFKKIVIKIEDVIEFGVVHKKNYYLLNILL